MISFDIDIIPIQPGNIADPATEYTLSNVAFDTILDMKNYVQQLPAVLKNYTIVAQHLDAGNNLPQTNGMTSITYIVTLRDNSGNLSTTSVTLPAVTPDGVQLNSVVDFANYAAQQGYIYMSATLPNGQNAANPSSTDLVLTPVADSYGSFSQVYVPADSVTATTPNFAFNALVEYPGGAQDELMNISFPTVAAMHAYINQLPATLLAYEVMAGGPSGTTYNVIYDADGNTNDAPMSLMPVQPTPVITATTAQTSEGSNPLAATTTGVIAANNLPQSAPASAGGGTVYRLIIATPDSTSPSGFTYNTGATYPTCAINNPNACVPMAFQTMAEATAYAAAHEETPLVVTSASQAWAVVAGTLPLSAASPVSAGMSTTDMLIAAGLILFLTMRK